MNKPIVDGLERSVRGQADVLRIDLLSAAGRQAGRYYQVVMLPTLIAFDGQGNELLRQGGMIDANAVRAAISGLQRETAR